ncbi:hypothetical protein ANANG_G00163730 [Anguilla anguilla]|uniref:Uncharacterized protein n=1 Tax=Anguilla anguilla TaxID=7936 RepID=A0A9D3MC25_ANGAN|nr:hypothetical protein ANANG_G00163730 [Anguilla anguilla]
MVLILLVFIAMCLWRNRQQSGLHKYDPPGYLYQPAEMNGHVLEYTTLPGTSRVNGGCPTAWRCSMGRAGSTPRHNHGHDGALPHAAVDYEHPHPHPHPHNGGGMYTALPQSDPSDCMSCQNFCNNNRCFTKANASFSNGSLPMMHRGAPCQPDGLEMVPLGHVTPRCHTPSVQQCVGEESAKQGEESEEDKALPLSQHSCCQAGECQHYQSEERDEEPPQQEEQEEEEEQEEPEPVSCWERLSLSDLDCNEKAGWVSTAIPAGV